MVVIVKQTSTKREAEDRIRKARDKDLAIVELDASRTSSELMKALEPFKGKRVRLIVLVG